MENNQLCVFNEAKFAEQFCSFVPDTIDGKKKLYNAINNPENRIADYINTPLNIVDVVVVKVRLSATRTAQTGFSDEPPEEFSDGYREGFRTILITDEGSTYTATSEGIYSSVKLIRNVFGTLHFEDGLKVVIKQVKTKNGNTLTLALD